MGEHNKEIDGGNVTPLFPEPEREPKPEPVVAGSVVVNCGGDRQINLNFHFGRDEDPSVQNAILDKIMALGDRQQARYSLKKMEDEFEEVGRHLRNFLNAIPVAEKMAQHQLAVLNAKLVAQREARDDVFKQGYEAHGASKRRGVFEPTGALKGRLNGMDIEIKKTEEAIAAVPADTAQHKSQTAVNIQKYQDDLKKRRAAINDLRKLAGLEPNTLFMDEQEAKVEG